MKLFTLACVALSFSVHAELGVVKVSDFELEYEILGDGKHTVLLESGASAGLSDWDPIFNQISVHAKVIRYSRVGNGKSTSIKRHFSSLDYADYARELIAKLYIKEPVIIVAHSYGGNIARDFAVAYPQQIKGLLMLEPSSEHDIDIMRDIDLKRANREIAEVKLNDMSEGMSNNYLDFWSKRPLPNYPQIKDMPVTVIVSTKKFENPSNLFFSERARNMWGKHWQDWAGTFPKGRTVLTEKSGHYVQFDEPQLVVNELLLLMNKLQ
ncbi:alpha/beta fold hydrolase [Shewanella sp. UCD-KL21]|uniref:alpha/beta fold hydrolase n=1 Tax=Shewanella sp. UCD-KL21 TaxID=1917164 RepID=UPI0009708F63|nr:alpha/beta hydrolase [Shewanella sp. UCD-KL21]